jgi:hypothetical protein
MYKIAPTEWETVPKILVVQEVKILPSKKSELTLTKKVS